MTSLSAKDFIDGIVAGNRSVLARAITLVESKLPADRELASEVLTGCQPHAIESVRVGITGVPGAGKSTFIDALGIHITTVRNQKVAVLAVDPSSPIGGGSILGDKTRMPRLSLEDKAFIRPSPSRGKLGGVTEGTRNAILLCEAAGYPNILVETVGVGQSEIAVDSMVDFFILMMLARAGDELQGVKRGILEVAGLLAFNKADGDNLMASELARRQFQNALDLFPSNPSAWKTRVVTCSALYNQGIAAIWDSVLEYRQTSLASGAFKTRRREQLRTALRDAIDAALRERFYSVASAKIANLEAEVVAGRISVDAAARALLTS